VRVPVTCRNRCQPIAAICTLASSGLCMPLSEAQRYEFDEWGFMRLSAVFSEREATCMRDRIWGELERKHSIRRDDPTTWPIRQPTGFQVLNRAGAFATIAESPVLVRALTELFGQNTWNPQKAWGVPLVTFPEPGRAWDVPSTQWHLDFPARAAPDGLPGVRILAFLHELVAHAGGTVVVAGSHCVVKHLLDMGELKDGRSPQVRDSLTALHPWFRCLWGPLTDTGDRVSRFMTRSECIKGIRVRVEELTGVAGDVILMHPWMFHAPAPNCGRATRIMISHSVFPAVRPSLQ
jgi:hypothetical protein